MIYTNIEQAIKNGFLKFKSETNVGLVNRTAGDRELIYESPNGLLVRANYWSSMGEAAGNYIEAGLDVRNWVEGAWDTGGEIVDFFTKSDSKGGGEWTYAIITQGWTPQQAIDYRIMTGDLDTDLYQMALSDIGRAQSAARAMSAQSAAQAAAPVYGADYTAWMRQREAAARSAQAAAQAAAPEYGEEYTEYLEEQSAAARSAQAAAQNSAAVGDYGGKKESSMPLLIGLGVLAKAAALF